MSEQGCGDNVHRYHAGGPGRPPVPTGQRALARSANREAIVHFRQALELLERLPEGQERVQEELAAQASLGLALIATQGFAAAEVGATFSRARELCDALGEAPQLFPVLWGL